MKCILLWMLCSVCAVAQMPPQIIINTNRIVKPYIAPTNHTGTITWATTNQYGYTGLMESTDLVHWTVWDCHHCSTSNIMYLHMTQPQQFFRAYCSTNWL